MTLAWAKPARLPALLSPRMIAAMPGASRARPGRSRRGRARPGGLVRGQVARGEDEAGDAERHVHPEHAPPVEVGEDRAADQRAEDRAEQRGQRDDRDGPAERLAARGLHDQGGHQRKHDAAADALDDAPARSASRRSTPGWSQPSRRGRPRARPSTAACRRTAAVPRRTAAPRCRARAGSRWSPTGSWLPARAARAASVCSATLTIVVSKMTAMAPTMRISAVLRTFGSILSGPGAGAAAMIALLR